MMFSNKKDLKKKPPIKVYFGDDIIELSDSQSERIRRIKRDECFAKAMEIIIPTSDGLIDISIEKKECFRQRALIVTDRHVLPTKESILAVTDVFYDESFITGYRRSKSYKTLAFPTLKNADEIVRILEDVKFHFNYNSPGYILLRDFTNTEWRYLFPKNIKYVKSLEYFFFAACLGTSIAVPSLLYSLDVPFPENPIAHYSTKFVAYPLALVAAFFATTYLAPACYRPFANKASSFIWNNLVKWRGQDLQETRKLETTTVSEYLAQLFFNPPVNDKHGKQENDSNAMTSLASMRRSGA